MVDVCSAGVQLIYFSPTGTTRRVLEAVAQGSGAGTAGHIDLTPPDSLTRTLDRVRGGLVLIGAPVYAGRLPLDAEQRLRRIEGHGNPAVLVVVYGNRAYDDALRELCDLASAAGFVPVAGAAFIGEHSYSIAELPLAQGRPDAADLGRAVALGGMIRAKLGAARTLAELPPLQVPGNRPYRQRGQPAGIAPVSQAALCSQCAACAGVCPTGAITVRGTAIVDAGACICCCACVKICPSGAMRLDHPRVNALRERLQRDSERREPEIFL